MSDYVLLPAVVVLNVVLGFVMGKLHERIAWNNLIRKGIIVPPKKRHNSNNNP